MLCFIETVRGLALKEYITWIYDVCVFVKYKIAQTELYYQNRKL
jgi:hypothetical protein